MSPHFAVHLLFFILKNRIIKPFCHSCLMCFWSVEEAKIRKQKDPTKTKHQATASLLKVNYMSFFSAMPNPERKIICFFLFHVFPRIWRSKFNFCLHLVAEPEPRQSVRTKVRHAHCAFRLNFAHVGSARAS